MLKAKIIQNNPGWIQPKVDVDDLTFADRLFNGKIIDSKKFLSMFSQCHAYLRFMSLHLLTSDREKYIHR